MLSKRRCPYTGVLNFYSEEDPHLAVGSVVASAGHRYVWRYYTEPYARGGSTADMGTAEREVLAARMQAKCHAQARSLPH